MKPLRLFRTTAVLMGVIAISFGFAPHACADLPQTLAEEAQLKAKIGGLQQKTLQQMGRVHALINSYGDRDANTRLAASVLRDYEKELAKAQKSLRGVQAKIARWTSDVAKDAAKNAAKTAAQNAARDAAMAAAKDMAKTGAKEAAKSASKAASKDSGQSAAKSAAHPSPPPMHVK